MFAVVVTFKPHRFHGGLDLALNRKVVNALQPVDENGDALNEPEVYVTEVKYTDEQSYQVCIGFGDRDVKSDAAVLIPVSDMEMALSVFTQNLIPAVDLSNEERVPSFSSYIDKIRELSAAAQVAKHYGVWTGVAEVVIEGTAYLVLVYRNGQEQVEQAWEALTEYTPEPEKNEPWWKRPFWK